MKKRWFVWFTMFASLSLVAAACAGDDTPKTTDGGGKTADACADDEFGCVEVAEGDPIQIGTLLVISGENASLGQDSQNGAVLAADFRDTPGEIAGHPVEFNHQDEACSAEGGQAGATALASEPQVVAVIGTSCSSAALGVADTILSDAGVVIISPSNTGPALTDPATHQPFYLRTAHNDAIQGAAVANFAFNEEGWKTASTIHDGSPYADGLQQVFSDTFASLGGTIAKQEAVQVGDTDFKPLLTDLAADNIDGLFFPIFVAEGGLITAQARTVPGLAETGLAGADGMFTPDWIEAAGADNAEGVFISGPDLTAFADPDFYENEFLPAYQEKFGEEPQSVFHAHSFDAFNLIADAIESVGFDDGGTFKIPRTALKDALFSVADSPGIVGNYTANENGDLLPCATMSVQVVEGGDFSSPIYTEELCLEG